MMKKAYEYRTMSDYNDFVKIEKTEVLKMYADMQEFISEMEEFIKRT